MCRKGRREAALSRSSEARPNRRLASPLDAEDGMVRRDPLKVVDRILWPDAAEELPDLPFPALEVGAEDRDLVGVRHLYGANPLTPAAEQEVGLACHS